MTSFGFEITLHIKNYCSREKMTIIAVNTLPTKTESVNTFKLFIKVTINKVLFSFLGGYK